LEDAADSEMCGFGISGAETLGLSIRLGKMELRKSGKWNWMRTVFGISDNETSGPAAKELIT
jgi:hypothetical protein